MVLNEDFSFSENKQYLRNLTYLFCWNFSLTLGFYYSVFKKLPPPPFDYWKQVYQELNTSDGVISNIMIQTVMVQMEQIVT